MVNMKTPPRSRSGSTALHFNWYRTVTPLINDLLIRSLNPSFEFTDNTYCVHLPPPPKTLLSPPHRTTSTTEANFVVVSFDPKVQSQTDPDFQ